MLEIEDYEGRVRNCVKILHHAADSTRVGRVAGSPDEISVEVVYAGRIKTSDLEVPPGKKVAGLVNEAIPISWIRPPPLIVQELDMEEKALTN